MIASLQRWLLYYPQRTSLAAALANARQCDLEPWYGPAGELWGWQKSPKHPNSQWLIFHGNAGDAIQRACFSRFVRSVEPDSAIYLLEYPGYGARAGTPSEQALLAAAQKALAIIPREMPLYLIGESLGGGIACNLAGEYSQRIHGVMLITPFNNLADLAAYHYPLLPLRLLLSEQFASDQALVNYPGPVAFILAGQDEVTPVEFGQKLFDGYSGKKRLWIIPNAHHHTILNYDQWWREAMHYLTGTGVSSS